MIAADKFYPCWLSPSSFEIFKLTLIAGKDEEILLTQQAEQINVVEYTNFELRLDVANLKEGRNRE